MSRVSLPRERFWDVPVLKIDSPTRQPLLAWPPSVRALRHAVASLRAVYAALPQWLNAVFRWLCCFPNAASRLWVDGTPSPLPRDVFDLVMRFGTSKSPVRTRCSTANWFPDRPASVPLRHTIASFGAGCAALPHTAHCHNQVATLFPLSRFTPFGKQFALVATGDYRPSLHSPWPAAGENFGTILELKLGEKISNVKKNQ